MTTKDELDELLHTVSDINASGPSRIKAIKLLEAIGLEERQKILERRSQSDKPEALHLGISKKLQVIQDGLRRTIKNSNNQVDVRCQAAATVAKTDNISALKLCHGIMERHIRSAEKKTDDKSR